MIITFITILAGIFAFLSTAFTIARIVAALTYSDYQKMLDRAYGKVATFPIYTSGTIAIISWAWLIARLFE